MAHWSLLPVLVPVLGVAGFVSGLAGFAFSGAAAVVLFLIPPLQAVPLLACLSVANQALSGYSLWHHMRIMPDRAGGDAALPFLLGGILGVPAGVELLHRLPASTISTLLGSFLIVFSLTLLVLPTFPPVRATGSVSAILTGWLGGVIGGFTAFPGAVPSAYLVLRRASKVETRGALQPYILGMQVLAVVVLAVRDPGSFNLDFVLLFAVCLPAVLTGSLIGVRTFHNMGDHDFRRAMLALLILSGSALVVKQILV